MGYIGVQPTDTYLSIASQQITGTGSATYTLDYSVSNEEDVAVFVNNVRQNVSTYTVSGTSLTLGGTISASDSCWVLFLGRTVGTKTPAVGSVTNDMLAGSIANAKLANSSITLNGSAVSLGGSATTATTNGITEADMWRLTTAFTGDGVLTSNLERVDTVFDKIGTGVSESSGIFSFPSTGIYLIKFNANFVLPSANSSLYNNIIIDATTNNSTYTARAEGLQETSSRGGDHWSYVHAEMIFDVTDITTHKVRFRLNVENNSAQCYGSTDTNITSFTFIRLGDT